MEKNSNKSSAKPPTWNRDFLLNEYYSNPSMSDEKRSGEQDKVQNYVPFSVEWQMYNA